MRSGRWTFAAALLVMLTAGVAIGWWASRPHERNGLQPVAEDFVTLALTLDVRSTDRKEVDAYFGPAALLPPTDAAPPSLDELSRRARDLVRRVERQAPASGQRGRRLLAQAQSLEALVQVIAAPDDWSFDKEARRVYRFDTPSIDREAARRALQILDAALPRSGGDLSYRLAHFNQQFVVPRSRRKALFERAVQECRAVTAEHWRLPRQEHLEIEWTTDVEAAWHRYHGNGYSSLQINPAAVAWVGSALDLACHEAYPGHHAQFLLMERRAGHALNIEDRVVLLRSPVSILREGAASYGAALAFPPERRAAFYRRVLFPMAGIDPALADRYVVVQEAVEALSARVVPILRDYHDGRLLPADAARALRTASLVASPEALLRFSDHYGGYVLGYTAARDRVRRIVQTRRFESGRDDWAVLADLVAGPDVAAMAAEAL